MNNVCLKALCSTGIFALSVLSQYIYFFFSGKLCQVALHIASAQGNFVAECNISETLIDVFILVSRRLILHALHIHKMTKY